MGIIFIFYIVYILYSLYFVFDHLEGDSCGNHYYISLKSGHFWGDLRSFHFQGNYFHFKGDLKPLSFSW